MSYPENTTPVDPVVQAQEDLFWTVIDRCTDDQWDQLVDLYFTVGDQLDALQQWATGISYEQPKDTA